MVDRDLAQAIVERHVLRPGRWVAAVHDGPDGVVVETDTLPWVVRAAEPPFEGVEVLEVLRGYHLDPPPAPVGVAVTSGGTVLLSDDDGFRSFWAAGGRGLDPDVVAELMAAYLSGGYRGFVVKSSRAPARRSERAAAVDGCGPMQAQETDGHLALRFCSLSVAPAETGEDRVIVTGWDVDAERDGPIRWSATQLADLPAD